MLDSVEINSEEKKVLVVGMGPAGIVSAIEAANKGHSVLIIENRDHFTRSQRVKLDNDTLNYFKSLNDIDKNTDETEREFVSTLKKIGNVEVNKIQEFLEKKLSNIHPNKVEIRRGSNHQVKDINLENNSVVVESNGKQENIKFSHIVGADGARHGMADMLNKAKGVEQIQYRPLENQTRQEPHGTISLRYEGPDEKPDHKTKFKLSWDAMPRLQALGWEEPYLPSCYLFNDLKEHHFYVAGEIPNKILEEKDPEKKQQMLVDWGKAILELQFGYQNVKSSFALDVSGKEDEKSKQEDRLKATAFPVTLSYTETPCVEINPGNAFVLMGDASKNANFHLGHGVNDAVKDGRKFGECLREDGFDIEGYQEHQKSEKSHMLDKMASVDRSLMQGYSQNMVELDRKILKEAQTLITLAALHDDENIKQLSQECKSAIQTKPRNYDDIYSKTLAIANQLNEKSRILQGNISKENIPQSSYYQQFDDAIKKQEQKLDTMKNQQSSRLFKAVTTLISPLGRYLQHKHEAKQRAVIIKIDKLKVKKQELFERRENWIGKNQQTLESDTQKGMEHRPLVYNMEKQKLKQYTQTAKSKMENSKDGIKDKPKGPNM